MVILKLLSEEVFDFSSGQMTQVKAKHLKDRSACYSLLYSTLGSNIRVLLASVKYLFWWLCRKNLQIAFIIILINLANLQGVEYLSKVKFLNIQLNYSIYKTFVCHCADKVLPNLKSPHYSSTFRASKNDLCVGIWKYCGRELIQWCNVMIFVYAQLQINCLCHAQEICLLPLIPFITTKPHLTSQSILL